MADLVTGMGSWSDWTFSERPFGAACFCSMNVVCGMLDNNSGAILLIVGRILAEDLVALGYMKIKGAKGSPRA